MTNKQQPAPPATVSGGEQTDAELAKELVDIIQAHYAAQPAQVTPPASGEVGQASPKPPDKEQAGT